MTKRFELTTDANIDAILLIIDHKDKVMWSFLKDHEEAVQGVFKRLDEQDQRITNLTRKLTETTRYSNQLIHLIEDYCEHYDDMTLQSKIDFGKILKHLGWEEQ